MCVRVHITAYVYVYTVCIYMCMFTCLYIYVSVCGCRYVSLLCLYLYVRTLPLVSVSPTNYPVRFFTQNIRTAASLSPRQTRNRAWLMLKAFTVQIQ